jgi:YkoY family integral membrane protein
VVDLLDTAAVIGTLVLLETILSFDNAALLTVLSRRLPGVAERRRVLNYGLTLAYLLRLGSILGASFFIAYEAFLTIGGLYLALIAGKHFTALARGKEDHQTAVRKPLLSRIGLTAFSAVIVEIALVDLVFAFDAVVAAVSFTSNLWLIVIAAVFGLLGLRLLTPFIGRLMDWLPLLEHMAFVAVALVGALMVLEHPLVVDHAVLSLSKPVKMGLIVSLFAVPILVKLLFKIPASKPALHAAVEMDFDLNPDRRGGELPPRGGMP